MKIQPGMLLTRPNMTDGFYVLVTAVGDVGFLGRHRGTGNENHYLMSTTGGWSEYETPPERQVWQSTLEYRYPKEGERFTWDDPRGVGRPGTAYIARRDHTLARDRKAWVAVEYREITGEVTL